MWAAWSGKPNAKASRFVDLYAQALDRLADPRPAQRIGALRSLEAISQDHPAGRPAIVDVICAYLRMPAVAGDHSVRQTAQLLLAAHLRPGGPGFWAGTRLNLAGATLTDFDLSGCRLDGGLRLDGARLIGPARLRGLICGGPITARAAVFEDHAWFERSRFGALAGFAAVTFHGDAWFGAASFGPETSFTGATFGGHAWFGGCLFAGPVDFGHAVFRRSAGFRAAAAPSVGLAGTTFLGPARVSRRGSREREERAPASPAVASNREDEWNVSAPGWQVVEDPDNGAVGQLLWVGFPHLVDQPDELTTPV
jgi:hypothetical protein